MILNVLRIKTIRKQQIRSAKNNTENYHQQPGRGHRLNMLILNVLRIETVTSNKTDLQKPIWKTVVNNQEKVSVVNHKLWHLNVLVKPMMIISRL